MAIRDRIRRWLGITQIQEDQAMLYDYMRGIDLNLSSRLTTMSKQIGAVAPGLGRVIAKLDPIFADDELDPARKAESDRIGEKVIERLKAEHLARQHTEGKL